MEETADGKQRKKLDDWVYNLGMCTFCSQCIEICPQNAIKMQNTFEHSVYNRRELIKHLNHPGSKLKTKAKEEYERIHHHFLHTVSIDRDLWGFDRLYTKRIFSAAIFLLLTLIGIAGIYILMEMQFIAALQIVVYVGGIVVLIIFSIFLTSSGKEKVNPHTI